MSTPCATGCPFLACPTCPYQGGPSESGKRHVSAGETACLPGLEGVRRGKIDGVSDPRERQTPGVRPETYSGGPDMGNHTPTHPLTRHPERGVR